jgi:hypothetical protein
MLSEGYRTVGAGHHATTFDFLAEALGEEHSDLVNYFDDCRRKRNLADYAGVGYVSETEASELLVEARAFCPACTRLDTDKPSRAIGTMKSINKR